MNKKEVDYININCPICGEPLIWGAEFDFEDYGLDGEGIVHSLHCRNGCCELATFEESDV